MNIPEDYSNNNVDLKKLNTIDKYILSKLEHTIQKVTKAMDKYEYGIASTLLYNFVYDDFCSFYIEMTKVSLNDDKYYKNGVYFTLLKVLKSIVMMIYPFSPFITEELYLNLPSHLDSIMLESYPVFEKTLVDTQSENKGELLNKIIESIRTYKVNSKLAPNAKVDIKIKSTFNIDDLVDYIARFTFANSIEMVDTDIENSTSIVLANLTLFIVDNIDKNELKNNLEKELASLDSEISRSEGLLSNENFVAKAPKAKLDLERNKYEKFKLQKAVIIEKLKKL
jgi:Valyl-tRNA synthetase